MHDFKQEMIALYRNITVARLQKSSIILLKTESGTKRKLRSSLEELYSKLDRSAESATEVSLAVVSVLILQTC